jgi:hypothetical protein
METLPAVQQQSTAAVAAAAGESGGDHASPGVDGRGAAGAGEGQQHGKEWHGMPRMLRQAAQLLNDPVLIAFGQLPAVSNSQQQQLWQQQGSESAGVQASASKSGVISALGLAGRWSGLAPAAAAAVIDADDAGGVTAPVEAVQGLPANVHLLTLMRADEGDPTRLILRLAHNFQVRCTIAHKL